MKTDRKHFTAAPKSKVSRSKGDDQPVVPPALSWRIQDTLPVPYADNLQSRLVDASRGKWWPPLDEDVKGRSKFGDMPLRMARLVERYPALSIRRAFPAPPGRLLEISRRAAAGERGVRIESLVHSFVVEGLESKSLRAAMRELQRWPETVRVSFSQEVSEPTVNPMGNALVSQFGVPRHFLPSPDGLDFLDAWQHPGGDGAGQHAVDVEGGWMLDHEDLVDHSPAILGNGGNFSPEHGTRVLGVICGVDNSMGFLGGAPNLSSINVSSHNRRWVDVPNAIRVAIENLPVGGVLCLEVQRPGNPLLPAETDPEVLNMVRAATALGVVVVAAAGNGAADLDAYRDSQGRAVLDRSSPDFVDSGAILVGACWAIATNNRNPVRSRYSASNYGSRIDCHAWGDQVWTTRPYATTTPSGGRYTNDFGATSAATAIIAAAALSIQGMAEQMPGGRRKTTWELRELLRIHGAPTIDPADRIARMPDLKAIRGAL